MPRHSQLARLLQAACTAQVAAALGWLAWRWPASAWQALAGAALILFIAPLVLGVEFFLLSVVGRADAAAPAATALQHLRAWWSETRHLYRTFYWRQPFRWRALDDHLPEAGRGRTGVVLVHGFMCNRGFWTPWMQRLKARGRAYVAVNLEPVYGSIDDYADAIDLAVQAVTRHTGLAPMLVCHSMGGLAARAWWRRTRGMHRVAHIVTIGSPHGGTWLGRFSRRANGMQMRLRSGWVTALAQQEQEAPLPSATCWYSNCDNIVFPPSTATLPLADNRFIAGEAHVALAFHAAVAEHCLQLLDELDARSQGKSFTGNTAESV